MRPRENAWVVLGLSVLWVQGLSPATFGQGAIAFVPIPAPAVSGETMTVTPAVSPDRRYVRLSVNAYFNAINGFSNYTAPLGAVGGGGGGGGLGGGLGGGGGGLGGGGLGGGGGGGGGGAGQGGGGTLDAGMNGVIGAPGFAGVSGHVPAGFVGPLGEMPAGDLPFDWRFGRDNTVAVGDVLNRGTRPSKVNGSQKRGSILNHPDPSPTASTSEMAPIGDEISATKSDAGAHPIARKSLSSRQKTRRPHSAKAADINDVEPIVKPKKKS
jgi:hypothetical protein